MNEEIWKNIGIAFVGFSKYEVSNFGNVRNTNGRSLKFQFNGKYLTVGLYFNNKQKKNFLVHRLVLKGFKPETYFNGAHVNHKNLITTDNSLTNLEFLTQKENNQAKIPRKSIPGGRIPIKQLSKDGTVISYFDSLDAAEVATGISAVTIGLVVRGKRKSAGGFMWKYQIEISLENEEWRKATFNDRDVFISNLGRIRLTSTSIPKIGFLSHSGYRQVNINNKIVFVHRLVAEAFVPGRTTDNCFVDHKNNNRQDNNATNLQWISNANNIRKAHNIKVEAVSIIDGNTISFQSIKEASRHFGIDQSTICKTLAGHQKTTAKHIWSII